MRNAKNVPIITEDILREANLSEAARLTVTALNKAVVITETDVLEYVPEELLELFDEFGISLDTVRNVLLEDDSILESLTKCYE